MAPRRMASASLVALMRRCGDQGLSPCPVPVSSAVAIRGMGGSRARPRRHAVFRRVVRRTAQAVLPEELLTEVPILDWRPR